MIDGCNPGYSMEAINTETIALLLSEMETQFNPWIESSISIKSGSRRLTCATSDYYSSI